MTTVYRCEECGSRLEDTRNTLCPTCARFAADHWGQPHAEEGAPLACIDEGPTKRVRVLSDAELMSEMEQHAECGMGTS